MVLAASSMALSSLCARVAASAVRPRSLVRNELRERYLKCVGEALARDDGRSVPTNPSSPARRLAARELAAGLGDRAIEAEFAHNRALAIARTSRSNQSPLTGLFGGRP